MPSSCFIGGARGYWDDYLRDPTLSGVKVSWYSELPANYSSRWITPSMHRLHLHLLCSPPPETPLSAYREVVLCARIDRFREAEQAIENRLSQRWRGHFNIVLYENVPACS
jgi:hypothetical protein